MAFRPKSSPPRLTAGPTEASKKRPKNATTGTKRAATEKFVASQAASRPAAAKSRTPGVASNPRPGADRPDLPLAGSKRREPLKAENSPAVERKSVRVKDAPEKTGRSARREDVHLLTKQEIARLVPTASNKIESTGPQKARQIHLSPRRDQKNDQTPHSNPQLPVTEPIRIQKVLSQSGLGSRRDMDDMVESGRVIVNGKPATPGTRVTEDDRVKVDGRLVRLRFPTRLPRVLIYHKQEGEIVTRDDPEGRVTVFDRLPRVQGSFWTVVGRLDFNTSGLLIFTTSGELANRLTHPRFEVEREYAVRVLGQLTEEQMRAMKAGVELEDGMAHFDQLMDKGGEGRNHWYNVILKEGRNREVRRMFEHFELTVSRLIRLRFGPVSLPTRLRRGTWAELEEREVASIMTWATTEPDRDE